MTMDASYIPELYEKAKNLKEEERAPIIETIKQDSAINTIASKFLAGKKDPNVAGSLLELITGYYLPDGGKLLVEVPNIIQKLIFKLQDKTNETGARRSAAKLIGNLAQWSDTRATLVGAGAFAALTEQINDENVMEEVAEALGWLIHNNDELSNNVIAKGTMQSLLAGLKTNSVNPSKSIRYAIAVGHLVAWCNAPLKEHAASIGVFQPLLKLLQDPKPESKKRIKQVSTSCTNLIAKTPANQALTLRNGIFLEHMKMLRSGEEEIAEPAAFFLTYWIEENPEGLKEIADSKEYIDTLVKLLESKNIEILNPTICVFAQLLEQETTKALIPTQKLEELLFSLFTASGSSDYRIKTPAAISLSLLGDSDKGKMATLSVAEVVLKMLLELVRDSLSDEYTDWYLQLILAGLANLLVNDANKEVVGRSGYVGLFVDVLKLQDGPDLHVTKRKHLAKSKLLAAQILWHVAYLKINRPAIKEIPGAVDFLKNLAASSKDPAITAQTKKNIEGAVWLVEDKDEEVQHHIEEIQKSSAAPVSDADPNTKKGHIMISYNWGCQPLVLRLTAALRGLGYTVWLDVDHMSGSTLGAMADAVESSSCILVCISRKYKDSPNCRLEGEYVHSMKKDFIPLMVESSYRPDGWLGLLLGAKLWFDFSGDKEFDQMFSAVVRELGSRGKSVGEASQSGAIVVAQSIDAVAAPSAPKAEIAKPVNDQSFVSWSIERVGQWLQENKLGQYAAIFERKEIDGAAVLRLAMHVKAASKKADIQQEIIFFETHFGVNCLGHALRLSALLASL